MFKVFTQYKGLRKEIYVLLLGRVVTHMGGMIAPMLALILSSKLNMSASDIATFALVVSIIGIPVHILGGKFADKWDKRNIIIGCDIVSVICFIICAIQPLSFASIIMYVIASKFQTFEGPAYDALTADITPTEDRDRTYSLSYLGNNLGMILCPIIGGLLLNNYLWLAFLINGLSIALSTVLIYFFVKDTSIAKSKHVNVYEESIGSTSSTIKYILNNRVIFLYIIYAGIAIAMYDQFNYLLPIDMGNIYGELGSTIYGTIYSTNCVVVVVATAFITRIISRFIDTHKMIIADVLEIVGLMIFAFFGRSIPMCYVSIIIFTFGEIINTIISTSYVSKRIPSSHRGRLLSTISVFNSLCTGVFQKICGIIYDTKGSFSAWSMTFMTGVLAIVLLVIISIWDKKDYKKLYEGL